MAENVTEAALKKLEDKCSYFKDIIQKQLEVKNGQIDRLHEELEAYKRDYAGRRIQQVMKQIISIQSRIKRRISSADWENLSAERLRMEYGYVLEDLTDLLEQQDIDSFETEPGSSFDAVRHMAEIVPMEDPFRDKTVKESKKEGFIQNGTVLVPERVIVYQYTK